VEVQKVLIQFLVQLHLLAAEEALEVKTMLQTQETEEPVVAETLLVFVVTYQILLHLKEHQDFQKETHQHTQTKIQVEPEAAEVQADLVVEHQDNQAQVQV
tara:strand:+ start:205 stop:507 length:303 start_codon:yes stop_codon:yes gene_type:complete